MASLLQSQKPDQVLKRAEEYVAVGKKESALSLIFDMLSNRRSKNWTQTHEVVMLRYLDLCIEVKNNRYAKEGLHQYRNIVMATAPGSLQKVVEHLIEKSINCTKEAARECDSKTLAREVDDLENDASPESILLEAVTSDKTRDRTEREILVPWLKFLWEAFRTVIDLLKSQPKLDALYHQTSRKCFLFCEEYSRVTEFRRLVELLRTHLNPKNQKYEQMNISTPETMSAHLETRFEQLRVASSLRLWQEGFRTIEDIHFIMTKSELKSSSKLMGNYYEKLTQLFLVSKNFLFHAYAYKKYFQLIKEKKKNISGDAIKRMASGVLLAAISIPLQNSKAGKTITEEAEQKEKNKRMAQLLGFDINPKRSAILKELEEQKILNNVYPEVKQIFMLLEQHFAPLDLVEQMLPLLTFLKSQDSLSEYVKPIEELLVIRLVTQLSTIFETVRLDYLKDLLANLDMSYSEVECTLIRAVKARQITSLSVRIDHRNNCIRFGKNMFEEKRTKNFIVEFAKNMKAICKEIDPTFADEEFFAVRKQLISRIREMGEYDHEEMLVRRERIEARRDELQIKQEEKAKNEQQSQLAQLEEKAKQEKERIQKQLEQKEREQEEKARQAEKLFEIKQELLEAGVDLNGVDLAKMTEKERDKLIRETQEKQRKAAEDEQKKKDQGRKKIDAFVRGQREIERAKIEDLCKKMVQKAKEKAQKAWQKTLADSKENHKKALETKDRTARMSSKRAEFEKPLLTTWKMKLEKDYAKRIEAIKRQQCIDKLNDAREKLAAAKEKQRKEEEHKRKMEELEAQRKRDAEESKRQALIREKEREENAGNIEDDDRYDEDRAPVEGSWRTGGMGRRPAPIPAASQSGIEQKPWGRDRAIPNDDTPALPTATGNWRSQPKPTPAPLEEEVPLQKPWQRAAPVTTGASEPKGAYRPPQSSLLSEADQGVWRRRGAPVAAPSVPISDNTTGNENEPLVAPGVWRKGGVQVPKAPVPVPAPVNSKLNEPFVEPGVWRKAGAHASSSPSVPAPVNNKPNEPLIAPGVWRKAGIQASAPSVPAPDNSKEKESSTDQGVWRKPGASKPFPAQKTYSERPAKKEDERGNWRSK